ncbi:MAG TPA: hypothetical protein VG455_13930 [Acidimicrobiales bacterium]|nr:hypothetical protein [Acidimicrobiales bacterium]
MKKRFFLGALLLVGAQLLVMSPATAAETAGARVVSRVQINANDPSVATVTVRYICQPGPEEQWLWVSAKQSATGTFDRRLQLEGSSQYAAAWLESHPLGQFTCDGTYHTDTFEINTEEQGFGTLRRGVVWLQFCLFDGQGNFINVYGWYPAS